MPSIVRVQPGAALAIRGAATPDAALRRLIERAARAALRRAHARHAEISITLLDDAGIAALNAEFLSHDGPTDVLSFPLYGPGEDPVGDIYIGYEQALRQARANRIPAGEELARIAIHGVLHVLGYDHPEGTERLQSEMWEIQESILTRLLAP